MPTTIDIESQRMLLGSTPVRKLYHGTSLIGMRIAELFAGGEPGVWYDPSDLSTLFQDSAGTTPVTAVEQPVGLMLDKSKGLVRGPELVTNGGFDNGTTGWVPINTPSVVTESSSVVVTNTGNTSGYEVLRQVLGSAANKTYECVFDVEPLTANTVVGVWTGAAAEYSSNLPLGRHTVRRFFTATGANADVRVGAMNTDAAALRVHAVSVRELPGNHAYQTTATSRPILSARYNLLTQTENLGHADWAATQEGTKCTVEQVQAPDGSMTAQKLTALVYPIVPSRAITVQGTTFRFVVWLKPGILSNPRALVRNNTTAVNLITANYSDSGITNQYGSCVVTTGPDGWKKFSFTVTSGISPGNVVSLYYGSASAVQIGDTWSVWHPDFRYLNDALSSPEYQRVGDATDYDTAGFPYYLYFDGVDDHLSIPSLDFSGASSAVAVIGMDKPSDEVAGRPYSHGVNTGQTGAFRFLAPANPGQASLRAAVRGADGTLSETLGANDKPAPIKTVMLASYGNGESITVRFNGSDTRVASGGPLTGLVLPNTRAIVGAQVTGDTTQTLFFVGRISGLLHIGRSLSEGERRAVERFINSKTRAY